MIRSMTAAFVLLCLTGTSHADSVCDKAVGRLTANQYFACSTQYDEALKAEQKETQSRQRAQVEAVPVESAAETERKLRLRQPVAGEIPIVAPYREIPIR